MGNAPHSLNGWQRFFRRFQFLEGVLPANARLPLRYHAQKFLGALEPEIKALPMLCDPNRVSIDIGANKGVYTYRLKPLWRHVHAFEPLKECCDFIEPHDPERITIKNCALSDAEGELRLFIPEIDGRAYYTRASLVEPAGGYQVRHVPVKKLDDFSFDRVGFIKVDVEGHELSVLKGARELLQRDTPNLLVEIDLSGHSEEVFNEVFNFLYELGYESFVYQNKALIQICGRELDFGASSINFIFRPSATLAAGVL
jgi:FkbM family methyltransferase